MSTTLLNFYEAIERASADMLEAARGGHWERARSAFDWRKRWGQTC